MNKTSSPVTGVFSPYGLEFIWDDFHNMVSLDFERHCIECPNEDHDDCYEFQDDEEEIIGFIETKNKNEAWYWFRDHGYKPDPKAEYSAIKNSHGYIQVVLSKYCIYCGPCSPCYPNQGDPDSRGTLLTYAIPPDVIGDYSPALKQRIRKC